MQIVYQYLKNHSEWLLRAVGQTPPPPNSNTLLYTMFHVGGKPFDQVTSITILNFFGAKKQAVVIDWNN